MPTDEESDSPANTASTDQDEDNSPVEKAKELAEKIKGDEKTQPSPTTHADEDGQEPTPEAVKEAVTASKDVGTDTEADEPAPRLDHPVEADDIEELEDEIKEIKNVVNNFADRLESLEDRELLEELQDLGMEEEIDIIQETLGYITADDQRRKLEELKTLFENWDNFNIPDKVNYLYSEISNIKQDLEEQDEVEDQVPHIGDRLDDIERRVDNLSSADAIEDLSETLDDHQEKLFTLRNRIGDINEQVEDGDIGADVDLSDLDELDELTDQVSELQDRLDTVEADVAKTPDGVDQIRSDVTRLQDKLSKLDGRVEDLQDEQTVEIDLHEIDEAIREQIVERASEKISIERVQKLEGRIAEQGTRQDELREQLQDQHDDILSDHQELRKEVDHWETMVDDLKGSVDQKITNEVESSKQEMLDTLGSRSQELRDALASRSDELEEKIDTQGEELDEKLDMQGRDLREEVDTNNQRLSSDMEDLQQRFDNLKEAMIEDQVDMQDEIDEMKHEFQDVVGEVADLEDRVLELSKAVRFALEDHD